MSSDILNVPPFRRAFVKTVTLRNGLQFSVYTSQLHYMLVFENICVDHRECVDLDKRLGRVGWYPIEDYIPYATTRFEGTSGKYNLREVLTSLGILIDQEQDHVTIKRDCLQNAIDKLNALKLSES